MSDLLSRKRIIELPEYKREAGFCDIRLDLNENPFNIIEQLNSELQEEIRGILFNRYPDTDCTKLKIIISEYTGVDQKQIAVGNGSDELIFLLLNLFLDKNDKMLIHAPTFSMYKQYADIIGTQVVKYMTNENFDIDVYALKELIEQEAPKLIIICNPNNPTGKALDIYEIEFLIKDYKGVVIIDEAYYEFYGQSAAAILSKYHNLVILRTFSKAFGLAGLRIGYSLSSELIKNYIDRIRSPFNVNVYSQAAAAVVLKNMTVVKAVIDNLKQERKRVYEILSSMNKIRAFDSKTNFILFRTDKAEEIYREMLDKKIGIRCFNDKQLNNCLRITIGTILENSKMLKVLGGICGD